MGKRKHQPKRKGKATHHHHQPPQGDRREKPPHYPVRIESTPEDEEWKAEQREVWQRQIALAYWMNAITAAGAVVALLCLAFLWATLQATQQSVDAARDSTVVAREALVIANRAWVKVKLDPLPDLKPWDTTATVVINLDNVGHVPAADLRVFAAAMPREADSEICRDDILIYQEVGSRSDLAPGGTSKMHLPIHPLDPDFIAGLKSDPPTKGLWIVGRFEYINGFKENGETRFCARWGGPDLGGGAFLVGTAYNAMR